MTFPKKALCLTLISSLTLAVTGNDLQLLSGLPQLQDQEAVNTFVNNLDAIRSWVNQTYISTSVSERQPRASVECSVCQVGIGLVLGIIRREGFELEPIKDDLIILCKVVAGLFIPPEICDGIINNYGDHLVEIIRYNPSLTALEVCSTLLGATGNCDGSGKKYIDLTIPGGKPTPVVAPRLPDDTPTVKILQLTDIHPDLHYSVGSEANCNNFICCRASSTQPENPEDPAGYHGDYQCDMPEHAMHELIVNAVDRYDYEFIIMSGDLVHHAVWDTNKEDNILHYDSFNRKLLDSVKDGVPIYPVLGNHEPHPCNLFVPPSHWGKPGFNQSWIYETLSTAYEGVLPIEALESYRARGFYNTLHKDTNLRIIALNNNLAYNLNFWLLSNLTDQEDQLQWLTEELRKAERDGEKVYIIGHVPPGGSSMWAPWNTVFNDIVLRFEHIIMGQFYGHTHNDEIKIFFDPKDGRPVNSLYIGASATAYTNLNPGYKVYHADGTRGASSTWEILDHETWIYNLEEANLHGNTSLPEYFKLYGAREEFGLKSLRPNDLYDFTLRMLFDGKLFHKYRRAFYKGSHLTGSCTSISCKLNFLCEVVKADSGDFRHCDRLEEILFIGTRPPNDEDTTPIVDVTTPTQEETNPSEVDDDTTTSQETTIDTSQETTTTNSAGKLPWNIFFQVWAFVLASSFNRNEA